MQRAKLRVIATNIMLCEKEIRQGKNVKENENKIKEYMSVLSMEDVLKMDEYIMKNFDK
jgi:hypothetical protein